jgi:VIT family
MDRCGGLGQLCFDPAQKPSFHAGDSEESSAMFVSLFTKPKRVLEPIERISEFLFGLIMVLTLTCSFRLSGANRDSVHAMFVEALGCNVAWGIIDAFFYLINCLGQRGLGVVLLRRLRITLAPPEGRRAIAEILPPLVASLLQPEEIESLRMKLTQLPESIERFRLGKGDWLGALAVFLIVFLSMFPLVVPFILVSDVRLAIGISNGIAILLLFLAGYSFGRFTSGRPWRAGIFMVFFGSVIVAVTVRLGG